MSISSYLPYIQLATGNIKEKDLGTGDNSGLIFQAARIVNVGREYFLTQVAGFKQLVKIPGFIELYRSWKGTPIVANTPLGLLFAACDGAKKIVGLSEVWLKLKGVFKPMQGYSIFSDQKVAISSAEGAFIKAAEVAEWTMSFADSYKWLAKIGFVAARTWTMNVMFNVASVVSLAHNTKVEGAKWWTGKIVDPITGDSTDFKGVDKIKSLFSCAIIAACTVLTTISVAEMAGYVMASSAFLTFTCSGIATAATIGAHFWEKLAY
ncbi:MAG TPA: hypothetical protein PKW79_07410 [Rhabdochlamydiaceae bacterium]|nr:hypothetical protein [Rhabdochlamydiaceae bacterium]